MNKTAYLEMAFKAFNDGHIDEDIYDCMVLNADNFCDEDDTTIVN